MSYIEKNLMNNESLVYQTRLHWIIFSWPVVCVIIAIVFL